MNPYIWALILAVATAVSPSVTLSVVKPSINISEPLEFTAVVSGPYEGGVCLAALTPDEKTVVGAICPDVWSDIDVASGATQTLPLKFRGPGVGEFHIVAVLSDSESPRIHSVGVPVTVVGEQ